MTSSPREVMLVGSVPLAPAEQVFETVIRHLGGLIKRIPDGEQLGWSNASRRTFRVHEALEIDCMVPLNAGGADPIEIYRLKPGYSAKDLKLGPYGHAENAINSYATFKRLRDAGVVPADTKFQVTFTGPGTSAFNIRLPADQLLPISRAALAEEIDKIARNLPADDLAIQLDIAMEAEHEEWLRRPKDFDQPLHEVFHWTLEQMAESAAWLADKVPSKTELGFHICSIWHHDPKAGQDNAALVDIANAVLTRVKRPVDYVHIPIIPEHTRADFLPFRDLHLSGRTKLFLGLLNLGEGLEGAKRKIAAAEGVIDDFGIAWYCGLGRPPVAGAQGPSSHSHPPVPALRRASPETIDDVLELHKAAAYV